MKRVFLLVAMLVAILATQVKGEISPPTSTKAPQSEPQGGYRVFLPIVLRRAPIEKPAKGVALDRQNAVCTDLVTLGAVWYFDFTTSPLDCSSYGYFETVPMAWGSGSVSSPMGGNSTWVSGFNEPNNPSQSNLTPHNAAVAWRTLETNNPSRKLASPGPYDGYSNPPFLSGVDWLTQFRNEYIGLYGTAPRLDAMAAHCYWQVWDRGGSDCRSVLNAYLSLTSSWGVNEIWLTEYNFMSGSPCNVTGYGWAASSDTLINFIKANPRITRYAWFTDRAGTHSECYWAPLYDNSGVQTIYGNKYVTY